MSTLGWMLLTGGVLLGAYLAFLAALFCIGRSTNARAWVGFVPDCIVLVRQLLGDSRVPTRAKAALAGLALYLALPFDLVPDFLPIAGQLDDALIVIFVLRMVLRATPTSVIEERWPGPEPSLGVLLRLAARSA